MENKNDWKWKISPLLLALVLSACGPTEAERAALAEKRRIECLDKYCEGDKEPAYDWAKETRFKVNGQWFVMPKDYGSPNFGAFGFTWPSKTPLATSLPGGHPERKQPGDGYDYSIEIFLRSNNLPSEPTGYRLIQLAEANDWIESRVMLRPGLEQIRMKHVIGPKEQFIDHVLYYVATDLKGLDGLPPVSTCSEQSFGSGGTGFLWQPGIWVGTRMNSKHCQDWPEIYQETARVLQLIKKAN